MMLQATGYISWQLSRDACQEAMYMVNHIIDRILIFQKMSETFQLHQKLVNDPSVDILSTIQDSRTQKDWYVYNILSGLAV